MEDHELRSLDGADLRMLVERLRRNESDLARRLADRAAALGSGDAPMEDPVYHRLHFVHRSVAEQRALAQRELASRVLDLPTSPPLPSATPWHRPLALVLRRFQRFLRPSASRAPARTIEPATRKTPAAPISEPATPDTMGAHAGRVGHDHANRQRFAVAVLGRQLVQQAHDHRLHAAQGEA